MSTTSSICTAKALLEAGDIGRCELIRGVLVMMSPAGAEHGKIANRIGYLLTRFVVGRRLGEVFAAETGFQIGRDPDTVRAPDVAFVREAALREGIGKGFWQGAPDLAVEVLSPNDTPSEIQAKVRDWLDAGASQVWVADPAQRTISVHRPSAPIEVFREPDELRVDDLLPGLRLPVSAVFA
jgi:Uma2 family endonuclease